ncbi:hypothetical protein PFISCL1PPCAC_62 [Pristionchus fissidentatus]|uniref:CENP-V/GFA domain-containing protein n=1 Tax=Pristionchus fissidentatus TaxID=1538716 RepID=A0AAV5UNR6_9BILA|nr:hypothetical protein PFISCL1PPCAC_62 [Pristionchus fissidentatus]
MTAVVHKGSCHCGAVQWEATAPARLKVYRCNCSICNKKSNEHFIVSSTCFRLIAGEDQLTTYTFNTHQAKHRFCKVCGVQSFYIPRSNPNDFGVMPHCIDSPTVERIEYIDFDGQKWEEEMKTKAPVAFDQ